MLPTKWWRFPPNHKNLAYAVGTDGKATEIQNPYFLKALDKRIDQLKSQGKKIAVFLISNALGETRFVALNLQ